MLGVGIVGSGRRRADCRRRARDRDGRDGVRREAHDSSASDAVRNGDGSGRAVLRHRDARLQAEEEIGPRPRPRAGPASRGRTATRRKSRNRHRGSVHSSGRVAIHWARAASISTIAIGDPATTGSSAPPAEADSGDASREQPDAAADDPPCDASERDARGGLCDAAIPTAIMQKGISISVNRVCSSSARERIAGHQRPRPAERMPELRQRELAHSAPTGCGCRFRRELTLARRRLTREISDWRSGTSQPANAIMRNGGERHDSQQRAPSLRTPAIGRLRSTIAGGTIGEWEARESAATGRASRSAPAMLAATDSCQA